MRGILLFARVPMNVVCLRPIYRALAGRVPFFGTVRPPKGEAKRDLFSPLGIRLRMLPGILARLLPLQVYLSSDPMLVGKGCRVKVHTFHGVSFKGRAYTPKVLYYDLLFIVGPYMEERFIEKGILRENDTRIARVGMPKLDALVDGTLRSERARSFLGISFEDKVVLYAPTWGSGSSLELFGEQVVKVCQREGLRLLVKLHDHTLRDPAWSERLSEWEARGVVIYRDPDVVPAMAASDMLVSDMSSVANEYLLLNRPLVTIRPPMYQHRYGDTADVKSWENTGALLVENVEGLREAMLYAVEHPDENSERRVAMAKRLFYNPGGATKQAVKVLKGLLDEDD